VEQVVKPGYSELTDRKPHGPIWLMPLLKFGIYIPRSKFCFAMGLEGHVGTLGILGCWERRRRGESLSCIYHSFAISAMCKTFFLVHAQLLSSHGQFLVAFDTIVIMPC